MNNNKMTDVSPWIALEAADELIKKFVSEGTFERNELKKSSRKFANGKDKADGYLVRVLAVSGKHPELEMVATAKRGRKATKPVEEKPIKKVEEVRPITKATFLRDIQMIDGKYKKLYSNDNDTLFIIDFDGERTSFDNITEATITFYGSTEEAKKHFWKHVVANAS